jgi:hypothetical protein
MRLVDAACSGPDEMGRLSTRSWRCIRPKLFGMLDGVGRDGEEKKPAGGVGGRRLVLVRPMGQGLEQTWGTGSFGVEKPTAATHDLKARHADRHAALRRWEMLLWTRCLFASDLVSLVFGRDRRT